jgi:hypothetical protein
MKTVELPHYESEGATDRSLTRTEHFATPHPSFPALPVLSALFIWTETASHQSPKFLERIVVRNHPSSVR